MFRNNETIKSLVNLEPYIFSKEELIQIIDIKKRKRKIDVRVISGATDFEMFLDQLIKDMDEKPSQMPYRVQVLYKVSDRNHWSAFDVLISSKSIKIFHMDAAGDDCDNFDNYFASKYEKYVQIISTTGPIQIDRSSCSVFALELVVCMSKIHDLHDQLECTDIQFNRLYKNLYHIKCSELPAILIRNAQSLQFILDYAKKHEQESKDKINKKGQTLLTYVDSHTIFYDRAKKKINSGIQYKQNRYRSKIMAEYIKLFLGEDNANEQLLIQRIEAISKYISMLAENGIYQNDEQLDKLKSLVQNGIHPDIQGADSKTTLLHAAAYNGKLELAFWLIEKGATIALQTIDKQKTPLHYAAQGNHLEMIQLLIKAGADINSKDSNGITIIGYAAESKNWNIVRWLFENNADIDEASFGSMGIVMMRRAPDDLLYILSRPKLSI